MVPPEAGGGMSDSVQAWAKRAAHGDHTAFRRWLEHTHGRVFRFALYKLGSRVEAEDVVQETYIRAWRQLPTLRDPDASIPWLFQIARNTVTDHVRKQGRRRPDRSESLEEELQAPVDALTPERLAIGREGLHHLIGIVASLKEDHRVVLLLREVDGLSYQEIASQLGIPDGTVESRLHRARKALVDKVERGRRAEARRAQ